MDKKQALAQIKSAKSAHIQWRARAQALVAGVELSDDKVPVIHTDCKFGKWYYGDGQELADLASFKAIEEPHELLHAVYMRIYKSLHQDDRSTFKKMFGNKSDFRKKQLSEAKQYLDELVDISNTLLLSIEQLENDLSK